MWRRLALAALVVALLPGAARAGACSPLTCAPSEVELTHGTLLAVRGASDRPLRVLDLRNGRTLWRLPPGVVAAGTLLHQDGALVTWYDAAHGTRLRDALLQVHGSFALVGASQHGRTAVLARTQRRSTTFVLLTPRAERTVRLGGHDWQFDALAGQRLFLVHNLAHGYEIRVLDLASGKLGDALRDPRGSARIWGTAWSRVSSADGRFLYTLYVTPNGASMVHVLDTQRATARCIDLPGTGSFDAASTYTLVADADARHLWALSPGYGRIAHIDVALHRVVDTYSFSAAAWNPVPGLAVMAPDGERIALTDAYHIWIVDLARRKVVARPPHVAIALGYSPDLKRLWVIGERSRVTALPA